VDLQLLSVDEGITGYRDDSLEVNNEHQRHCIVSCRTLHSLIAVCCIADFISGWLGGSVVERRSLTGELSLVCTRTAADG